MYTNESVIGCSIADSEEKSKELRAVAPSLATISRVTVLLCFSTSFKEYGADDRLS
jgi:hypothetical protein